MVAPTSRITAPIPRAEAEHTVVEAHDTKVGSLLWEIDQDPQRAVGQEELGELSPAQRQALFEGLRRMAERADDQEVALTAAATSGGFRAGLRAIFTGGTRNDVSKKDQEAGNHRRKARALRAIMAQLEGAGN